MAGDGEAGRPHLTKPAELHSDAVNQLKSVFVKVVLEDQDCFRSERGWETLLSLLPSDKGV